MRSELSETQTQLSAANQALTRAIACGDPIRFKQARDILAIVKNDFVLAKNEIGTFRDADAVVRREPGSNPRHSLWRSDSLQASSGYPGNREKRFRIGEK